MVSKEEVFKKANNIVGISDGEKEIQMLQDSKNNGDICAFIQLLFVVDFLFAPFSFWLKRGASSREGECSTS